MRHRGLTLLEVLIALAMGIVLLGAVTTFAWSQLASRQQVLETANARRTVTLVIDRLEQDLISAVAGTSNGQAGVRGDATSLVLFSRGVAPAWTDDPATMIGDLHRLELAFDTGSGQVEMTRSPHGEDDLPAALPGTLEDLRLRYFDGSNWSNSWDSLAKKRLPVAVEITAWYGRPETTDDEALFELSQEEPMAEAPSMEGSFESTPDRRRVILVPDAGIDDGPPEPMA